MRGCYQIDIVGSEIYQLLINRFQPFNRNYFTLKFTAYIVILAIYTVEVAPRKKDRSGAFTAADHRFFPMVQSSPCHHRLDWGVANSRQYFTGSERTPHCIAFTGAYFTLFIHIKLLVTLHPLPDDRVDHKVFQFFAIFDFCFAIRAEAESFQIFRIEYLLAPRATQTASGIFRIFKFQRFFIHKIHPKYLSASIAARQPAPAAVIACR